MASVKQTLHPKIDGKRIGKFHGLTIYASLHKAKQTGRDRIWIQVRQDAPKKYRVAECLSYMRSVDVQFETTD